MTPNARWPSVVQEMPGREFHVTGFQRVEWREKSSFNMFSPHCSTMSGDIFHFGSFFCLIAPTLFKKLQYITFVLWFQVSSTRFFGLQTQYWLWINRSEAWPGWLQKSTSAPAQGWRQGEVMMTEGGSRSVGRLCHVCSSSLSQQAVSLETLWMFWIQWAPSCTGTCPSQCKCSTASSGRCLVVSASFHSSATMTGRGFTGSAMLGVFWRYSPRLGWSWWQRRGRVWRILFLVWFSPAGAATSASLESQC